MQGLLHRLVCLVGVATSSTLAHADEYPRRLPPVEAPVEAPASCAGVELAQFEVCEPVYVAMPSFATAPGYEVGAQFNRGLFIRSTDLQQRPYEMYLGGRLQLRYIGFTRSQETWTDSAGVTRAIRNRNQFDTERVRLNISGKAISPDLDYLFIYDADGDAGSLVDGLAFHFTYAFDPAFKLRLGRWKAAAHREWLLSSRYSRMVDRSLATEFFRVGFSDGVWLLGDFDVLGCDGWHYEASLTNGLRTSSREALDLDDNFGFAANVRCDPLGAYGAGLSDYAWHDTPVVRIGASIAVEKSEDRGDAGPAFVLGDNNFLRLSDGTRLADVGALAPGVTLLSDRLLLAAVDLGVKYRGWSFNAELFLRTIDDLVGDAALPINEINTYGYHAEVGKFLIAKRLGVNARVSQVTGFYGDSYEYSAGFNYYWGDGRDDRVNKFAFDVARVVGSAVNSSILDMLAGDDGVLIRAQTQVGF